jgi:hypothetical protein
LAGVPVAPMVPRLSKEVAISGIGQGEIDLAIELVDDLAGRSGRRAEAPCR